MVIYRTLDNVDVKGKQVLVRVDYNVPIVKNSSGNYVTDDDTRIKESLETIKALSSARQIILMSHHGRPQESWKAIDADETLDDPKKLERKAEVKLEESLAPVAKRLGELLHEPVAFVPDCLGDLPNSRIVLLENTRFYKAEEKPEKDPSFVLKLARGDIFVEDAFGSVHRAHTSTFGVPNNFALENKTVVAGKLLVKEDENLKRLLDAPKEGYVAILGGKKVSDKIGVIDSLLDKVDSLIIGGAMAYTFLKYLGVNVGNSFVETEIATGKNSTEPAKTVLDRIYDKARTNHVKIYLPTDHLTTTDNVKKIQHVSYVADANIPSGAGVDIGEKTIAIYQSVIEKARTILWNGPMGVFEQEKAALGTMELARIVALATQKGAFSVVGGGDSVSAVNKSGYAHMISHISTGGGASLEYLANKGSLPGIDVLKLHQF